MSNLVGPRLLIRDFGWRESVLEQHNFVDCWEVSEIRKVPKVWISTGYAPASGAWPRSLACLYTPKHTPMPSGSRWQESIWLGLRKNTRVATYRQVYFTTNARLNQTCTRFSSCWVTSHDETLVGLAGYCLESKQFGGYKRATARHYRYQS